MAESPNEPRQSPLWPSVILLVGFFALIVVGVVTVLVPEIQDDTEEEPQAKSTPGNDVETQQASATIDGGSP